MKNLVVTANCEIEVESSIFSNNLVNRWLTFSAVSPKSITTYKGAVKQLLNYFTFNNISQPSREDIIEWRESLKASGKSPSTIQLYITSAKLFFRWLSVEGIYPNIADHIKSGVKINHEHKKDCLSKQQAGALIKSINGDNEKALRDRAIVALMITSGCRCIEICRADVGDIVSFNGDYYLRVQGKGHSQKDAFVRIAPQVKLFIDEYLSKRGNVSQNYSLFVSTSRRNKGARLSAQAISKMVKSYLRGIGIDTPRITCHSATRHTAATQMLLNGATLEQVQQALRHVNIGTTMIYNHTIQRMKNQAECLAADAIFAAC